MAPKVPERYWIHQIEYSWHPTRDMYPVASSMSPESVRSWHGRLAALVRHPGVGPPNDSMRYEIFGQGLAALIWRRWDPGLMELEGRRGRRPLISRVLIAPADLLTPEVAVAACYSGLAEVIGPQPGSVPANAELPTVDGAALTGLALEMAKALDEAAARQTGLDQVVAVALGDRDTPLSVQLPERVIVGEPWGGLQLLLLWGLRRTVWPVIGSNDGRRGWSFSTFEPPQGDMDTALLPDIVFRQVPTAPPTAPARPRRELWVRPLRPTARLVGTLPDQLARLLVMAYGVQGGDELSRMVAACTDDTSVDRRMQAVVSMLETSLPAVTAPPPVSSPTLMHPTPSRPGPGSYSARGRPADTADVIEVAVRQGSKPGTLSVEVVSSPAGEASAVVALDVDDLLAQREQLQWAVLASGVASRRILSETERPVQEIGKILFTALLAAGEVSGRYRAAAAVAAERGRHLRVVLRTDSPALAALPWEAMYDEVTGAYVCRQDQLVRHVGVASVQSPLSVRPPLRILGVVSSPRGLPMLDVEKEQDHLAHALARPVGQGLVEIHWAPRATWADLHDMLLEGPWHVVHYIGHGDFDPVQDEGILALVADNGRMHRVAAHRLVDLLRQASPMPRLVVLNSCEGAQSSVTDLFSSTAAALVRGGVTAVAAMQYAISDYSAAVFARGFYTAVAHGRGIDEAVSSGRVAILGTSDHTLEWLTPVLYLRGRDTQLFAIP